MIPTIGRTVIYQTTEEQRKYMEESGTCNTQLSLPATIVFVWGYDEKAVVNLKVHVDGATPDLWVTSVVQGNNEGEWHWPPRV